MSVMPRLSRFGAVEALGEYCSLALYFGASHLWGECWGAHEHGVLEAFQGFVDRVGHEDVDVISRAVPFDGQAAVLDAIRVDGD